ncbi:unnamed protein product [Pylaiella littoralis]
MDCSEGLGGFTRPERDGVARELSSTLALLLLLADRCNIDLPLSIQLKIQLNAEKYPAAIVRGSALKYDAYQATTGFGKGSKQVTTGGAGGDKHLSGHTGRAWSTHTLQGLRVQLQQFAKDRGWEKFHTPRNICLALSGEAGELCELFQFKDEEACCTGLPGWTRDERDKLSQELSDVCIYLTRLSDVCGIDLSAALLQNDHSERPCCRKHEGHPTYHPEQSRAGNRWTLAACMLLGLAATVVFAKHTRW